MKLVVGAAVIAALLTGCDAGQAHTVRLPDGRTVVCVGYGKHQDCDWGHAQ